MLRDRARLLAVERAAAVTAGGDTGLHRLTALAARELGVDFGFLSLVSARDELLVAVHRDGAGPLPTRLPVEQSVCRHLVESGQPLFVRDLAHDSRLSDLVEVRELGLRAYAGIPVTDPAGAVLGGLCVGHGRVRFWRTSDRLLLTDVAAAVSTELALRVALEECERPGQTPSSSAVALESAAPPSRDGARRRRSSSS